MKKYSGKVLLFFVLLSVTLLFVGCSNTEKSNSKNGSANTGESDSQETSGLASEVEVDEETGFKMLNIYEDKDVPSFEAVDYEHYDHDLDFDFDYVNIHYLDQDIIIDNTEYDIRGYEWRTGELLWNESGIVAKQRFTAPVYADGYMYYQHDDIEYKVPLSPDAEPEEMDDIPYNIRNEYNSVDWENGYVIDSDTDAATVELIAINKSDDTELWTKDFTDIKGVQNVKELDGYLIFQSALGDLQYYILDKSTGDIVYKEDYYYLDMYQIEDEIYIADDDHIHVIDTKTWEKEEVTPISIRDYQYESDYFVYYENEGILALHMYKGILTIDLENKEPHLLIESIYEDGDNRHIDIAHFYHDGYLYLMNNIDGTTHIQLQEDQKKDESVETDVRIVTVVDLTTGEIKAQKAFNFYVNVSNNHFVKGNDDKFIIATRFDGIFEIDLSFFE